MRPIPPKLKEEMATDPFYEKCCIGGDCAGRIEWHHALIYAGRQINEKWAILPACHKHHAEVSKYDREFKRIAVSRATDEELLKYPKAKWHLLR